jgi:hypothetical protein
MRNLVPLASLAILAALAVPASAAISSHITPVAINPTLAAAGWTGNALSLRPDAASQFQITVVDMKNDTFGTGGIVGIHGPLHQRWNVDFDSGALLSTPVTGETTPTSLPATLRRDSSFLNQFYFSLAVPDPFTEDNNRQNGSNPPFTRSPLADVQPNPSTETNGVDYGVGSLMTFTGAIAAGLQINELYLATIIIPAGGTWQQGYDPNGLVTIQGVALDPKSVDFETSSPFQFSYMVPEPATLALLAPAAFALLRRRL